MRRVILGILAVLVFLLVVSGIDAIHLYQGVKRVDLALPGAGDGAVNYLLVGSDSRAFVSGADDQARFGTSAVVPGERADLMLLIHVPEHGPTRILPLPRDLVVDTPGRGSNRLTLAYTDGPQRLIDTLCSSLGLGLDHLITIRMDGFRRLIDDLGGIDIDVERPTRDATTGLDLTNAGRQRVDGQMALAFVRSRHTEHLVDGVWLTSSDQASERTNAGETVSLALGHRVEAESRNPIGLRRVLGALSSTITVDSAIGVNQFRQLRSALSTLDADHQQGDILLPTITEDGPVPTAHLGPGAGEQLRDIGAGQNERCPNVPVSRLPATVPGAPPTGGPTG